jgi:hypothetical protein
MEKSKQPFYKGMDAFKKDEIRRDAIHEEMNQLRAKLSQLTRSPANFRSMSDVRKFSIEIYVSHTRPIQPSDPQDRGDNERE